MGWLNVTRNINTLNEEIIGWLAVKNDLWAITFYSASGSARLRKKLTASGDPSPAWASDHTSLPASISYDITGFAEDTENNKLYIANGASGDVFFNVAGDPAEDWGKLLDRTYGNYVGAEGNIKDLIFYNSNVYLAHKGGVSSYNYDTAKWELVGDFTKGFNGVGQCNNFYILNHELYVTVGYGDLGGAVYKYNADTLSLDWDKVAELPTGVTHPEYLTARNNILFCTNNGIGQNIFNSKGIDTTLTGQPRFTHSTHLAGVPSSIHTFSEDNSIYATCWDTGFSGSISNAYTNNLITSVRQLKPYSAEPGETFISTVTGESLSDYTTYTTNNGGEWFSTTSENNPELAIKFAIQTNGLQFLPGETYTISWDYGFSCFATARTSTGALRVNGSGPLTVGFRSNAGTGIDINSPKARYTEPSGNLFSLDESSQVKKHIFTFKADDISTTTNGEFRIEGVVKAAVKGGMRFTETWRLQARALIKNLKIYRGGAEIANAQFIDAEYIVKEYSDIPIAERENHAIEEPSPPDQWFVKFTPVVSKQGKSPQALMAPPGTIGEERPGGTTTTTTTTTTPTTPTEPPPSTQEGGTTVYGPGGVNTNPSRLLATNQIDLVPGATYRFHALVNRVKNPDSNVVLKIHIKPSLAELRPVFDGTIATSNSQFSIEWEFSTSGISAENLLGIRFYIDIYEEGLDVDAAATVYISDINILGKIRKPPINSIFRYNGEVWDNKITGKGITGHPHSLVEAYEEKSNAQRLYCISDGDAYVWSTVNDPYGSPDFSRIIVCW